jgi:IS5 family transposase
LSSEVVEREVRANLVYRSFTRIGSGKVPDDAVMNKGALTLTGGQAKHFSGRLPRE